MATTTLYPNQSTYNTVVAAVLAGNTAVLWVINNRAAIRFQPSVVVGEKVGVCNPSVADDWSGIVVKGGNSGLASVDGSYDFVWNPKSNTQDDAAQAAVLSPTSLVLSSTLYSV